MATAIIPSSTTLFPTSPLSTDMSRSPSDIINLAPRPSDSPSDIAENSHSPASMSIPAEVISSGVFSKTWVLPPRKKPGRKAANDVPPTKRQAQNRAAQKAFRDRKAQRVSELEKENDELKQQIEQMEAEINALRAAAQNGFHTQHRHSPHQNNNSNQLASPAPSSGGGGGNCETCVIGKDCTCLNQVQEPEPQRVPLQQSTDNDKCGLCTSTEPCLCEDLGIKNKSREASVSSPLPHSTKRKRSKSPVSNPPLLPTPQSLPMEIDFTSAFSSMSPVSQRESLPSNGCGFCSEGTPCVCALPPGSDDSVPLTRLPNPTSSRISGCTGEPGTCLQCRTDPMSTLFCQTLSRKLEMPVSSVRSTQNRSNIESDTFIPCSAVYQTLSRHRNFNKMSLEVIVNGLARGPHRGMEFAAGGIQGLLREMDKDNE